MVPMAGMSAGEALGMWVVTGVLERFPGLKVVFVEPGLGWVAWYLYIIDDMATRQKYDLPGITELPSFYFHRNVFLTFIEEPDAVQHLRHGSARATSCGPPTTRTRCRAGPTRARSRRSRPPACPPTTATSSSPATLHESGTSDGLHR